MDQQDLYFRVKERVKRIRAFYEHLFVYIVIVSGVTVINYIDSPDDLWFYYPMIIWGVIVIAHAIKVFGKGRTLVEEWEDKKMKELLKTKKSNEN
ncbi:MAG: 2TM domain-containing protein [Ignavibacteria bacterium]|nr:2TM domain-containing protein [Ignavibacteria bacterium]